MKSVYTLILLFFTFSGNAQTISTFYQNASIDDGLAIDSEGNLYGSHYTGSIVWKITPDGVRSKFMSGLDTPNGLAFDSNGDLYIVDNQGGKIYKVAPDSTVTTLVPDIFSPSGIIKMPESDTMVVSCWEGNRLVKVAPDGSYETFVQGNGLVGPVGLAYDENDNLYVGNYTNRWIYRVSPSGNIDTITHLNVPGQNIGFIAYREGFIYATIPWDNKIYKVDPEGNYELYAGSSQGSKDGDISEATFNQPNGILLSPGGDSLYISDFNTRSVRIISNIDGTVGTNDFIHQSSISESVVAPNPAIFKANLDFELSEEEIVSIIIFNIKGQLMDTVLNNQILPAGKHQFPIDTGHLPSGNYFIQISSNSGDEVVKKLVVEN